MANTQSKIIYITKGKLIKYLNTLPASKPVDLMLILKHFNPQFKIVHDLIINCHRKQQKTIKLDLQQLPILLLNYSLIVGTKENFPQTFTKIQYQSHRTNIPQYFLPHVYDTDKHYLTQKESKMYPKITNQQYINALKINVIQLCFSLLNQLFERKILCLNTFTKISKPTLKSTIPQLT